jgi:hypothetical protein
VDELVQPLLPVAQEREEFDRICSQAFSQAERLASMLHFLNESIPERSTMIENIQQESLVLQAMAKDIHERWESMLKNHETSNNLLTGPDVIRRITGVLDQMKAILEIEELVQNYQETSRRAREAFVHAFRCLEIANGPSTSTTISLARVAEATVAAKPTGIDLLTEIVTAWNAIIQKCNAVNEPIPVIEPELRLDALQELNGEFERKVEEILANQADSRLRLEKYTTMIHENEAITQELLRRREEMTHNLNQLNSRMDESLKSRVEAQIQRRAEAGCLWRNDPARVHEYANDTKAIVTSLIPNLAVKQNVAQVEPATLEQVEATARQLLDLNFRLIPEDPKAAFHLCAAIAQQNDLAFAMIPSPSPEITSDAWNKSADFAMANDVLTESSLPLLSSNCPEHHVKGISLRLQGDLPDLEANPASKDAFLTDARMKLAVVHGVDQNDIVILRLSSGSVTVTYTLISGSPGLADLEARYTKLFGPYYLRHDIHPSFSQLNISPDTFSPTWNADFAKPKRCPVGTKRGGFPYNPPAGWKRYGMNVAGKFKGGDTWLGMKNIPGEWAVVYHGTKARFVKPITEEPLQPGARNAYGYGIYCSPNPRVSGEYTDQVEIPVRGRAVKVRYMFMCRVNVRSVHYCTHCPCPLARDSKYTVHITTRQDYWFVNCENQGYQNIRQYGLLVKED